MYCRQKRKLSHYADNIIFCKLHLFKGEKEDGKTLTEMAVELATAQASHSTMSPEEMESYLKKTFQTLKDLKNLEEGDAVDVEKPAVPVLDPKRSILKNKVICLECGQEFKILTNKHLEKEHNMIRKNTVKSMVFQQGNPYQPNHSQQKEAPPLKNISLAKSSRRRGKRRERLIKNPDALIIWGAMDIRLKVHVQDFEGASFK